MTAKSPTLVVLACPRGDCSNAVTVLPGGKAWCNRHPRTTAMVAVSQLELTPKGEPK